MMLHPAVIALVLASIMICLMILYGAYYALRIMARWDLQSGSEEQLDLERKTYLISMILSYVFFFQIGSLFLYIYTADNLHNLFVGAMCAAGSLHVDPYGYPTLGLKIFNGILAGLWLILNHADNRAHDYPLIKKKYALLLVIAPFIAAESISQWLYFSGMKADVITSCCGSLFSSAQSSGGSDIAGLPVVPAMTIFYSGLALTFLSGLVYLAKDRLGYIFSGAGGLFFAVAVISLVSFISLYFYELPTHHCPFCILQKEYGYVGYILYATLLCGVVTGLGVGILMPCRKIGSLKSMMPRYQRRLTLICLGSYGLFSGIAVFRIATANFTMGLF